jgi:hypothetical protein
VFPHFAALRVSSWLFRGFPFQSLVSFGTAYLECESPLGTRARPRGLAPPKYAFLFQRRHTEATEAEVWLSDTFVSR